MSELNILGQPVINQDFRYSIAVYLIRDERPKYWAFHCPRCGEKLCELDGEVAYMSDLAPGGAVQPMLKVRCNSRICGGRLWWEFVLAK